MNHPTRNRATSAIKTFVAGLLTLTMLSAALAQSGGAPFQRFTPTGVMEVGGANNNPQVFTPLPNAVGRFDGGWFVRHPNFTNIAPETSWDSEFVVLASNDVEGGKRMNGFFGYQDRTTKRVAMPFWETDIGGTQWFLRPGTVSITPPNHPTDGQGFVPKTGFVWRDNNRRRRLNVFGTVQSAGDFLSKGVIANSLRELYWDGQWRWTDHGRPDGTREVIVGRNAALWNPVTQQGRVFIVAARQNTGDLPSVYMRLFEPATGWTWQNLGVPVDRITPGGTKVQVVRLSAPVSVGRVENGVYKVNVFVVGNLMTQSGLLQLYRWELYERYWNGVRWEDWKSYGQVPGTFAGNQNQVSQVLDGGAIMTSGVVWNRGTTLRINLFGYTQWGDLIDFFWDGRSWQWDLPDRPPGREKIRTTSSVLDRRAANDRVNVYSRGESGAVWQRTLDTRVGGGWSWGRLLR